MHPITINFLQMKQIFPVLLLFFSTSAYNQDSSLFRPFIRSVERNFIISYSPQQDSCLISYTLLRIDIDTNYSVSSVSLSDNAPGWQIESFNNVKRKFDTRSVEEYAKRNELKAASLFFPFIIRKEGKLSGLCPNCVLMSHRIFQFNGQNIKGASLFADRIEITYY
jgi:hypothetical protein